MDGSSFTSFNTGNRKNFLDKARKKKEIHTAIYASNEQIVKVQKNIRRFIQLTKMRGKSHSKIFQVLFCDKQEVFERPEVMYQHLVQAQSLLVQKKMQILAIEYVMSSQTTRDSQRNNESMGFSSQDMEFKNQYKSQAVQKIMEVLSAKVHKAYSFLEILSSSQRKFWITEIYLKTDETLDKNIAQFSKPATILIQQLFLREPLEYLRLFSNNSLNCKAVRQITQLICLEKCPSIDFEDIIEKKQFNIVHESAYSNFRKCFWGFTLQDLELKDPNFLMLVIDYFLKTLSKNCCLEIMETYKILKHLYVSEFEATEQIVKQKLQWLSFVDFLDISGNSLFMTSLLSSFVRSRSLEESLGMMGVISTMIQISKVPSKNIQNISLNYKQLQIVLDKIATWISIHQIQMNQEQQKLLFAYLEIIQNILFNMWDKDFIEFFQGNEQYLQKLIKNSLIKIIYKIIFLKKPTPITDKVFVVSIRLLENLYNKIFRTRVISTEVFVNEILSNKLRLYRPGTNIDEVSHFIQKFPFIFPLMLRLEKFRQFVYESRHHNFHEDEEGFHHGGKIEIRRGREFEDAFNAFNKRSMRRNLNVEFINQYGMKERGIDAGGLTKELINRVLKAIFSKQFGMFIENSEKQLLPHPQRAEVEEGVISEHYMFIGKMIGKALFEGITIGPKFSGPFLNALIGKRNNFEDLRKIDKDLYNSLLYIRDMEEDAKDLYLTFQFKDQITRRYVNLKSNGSKINVTNQNKEEYISLLTNYKVNKLLEYQSRHISKGLSKMINKEWLHMFNYQELNYLISGSGEINVQELKLYTQYQGYAEKDKTVQLFWKVVREFDQENRSNLLMFVTSCPRPSFLGFKDLNPKFTIIKAGTAQSLPVSHTCSNVLELPDYKDEETLKKKLLMAINSDAGFEIA